MLRISRRILLALLAVAFLCSGASAQQQYNPYSPGYAPTFSPNFQYFRRDTGPFNQYLSFVRPARNLQNLLQSQNNQINLLQGELRRVGEQQAVQQTGTGSIYMNHLPYFQNQNTFYTTRSVAPGR